MASSSASTSTSTSSSSSSSTTTTVMEKRIKCVLALGGSFNPIHTQHVELLCGIREYLEQTYGLEVVKGYLVVAPNGWVVGKLGPSQTIKDTHRLAMARLAADKSPWIEASYKTAGSASSYVKEIIRRGELVKACGADLTAESLNPDETRPLVVYVEGGDKSHPRRWCSEPCSDMIIVAGGRGRGWDALHREWTHDLRSGKVKLMVGYNNIPYYIMAPLSFKEFSSTQVRERLQLDNTQLSYSTRCKNCEDLVAKGILYEEVGKYLIDHWDGLLVHEKK